MENNSYCFGCNFFNGEILKCTNQNGLLYNINLSESLAESDHDCKVFEEIRYCLTPKGILLNVLNEYNIDISYETFDSMFNRFTELMKKHGYLEDNENHDVENL